jgi:protein-disulfide isomerase
LASAAAVSLVAAFFGPAVFEAQAQVQAKYPLDELLQPGPLGEMALGSDNAPVTIIEYATMTSGHCATFHEKTLPELKKRYIDTGKVRLIFREFPFDPVAAGAFMLARCAPKDRYFPLVDALFALQNKWAVQRPIEPLLAIAKQVGFTQQTFEACLADQIVLEGIEAVRNRAASKFGVDSTPTFFINGVRHKGAMSIDEMAKLIEPHLKS